MSGMDRGTLPLAHVDRAGAITDDARDPDSLENGRPAYVYVDGEQVADTRVARTHIDLGDDAHDHLIPAETHFQIAMTRQ